MFEEIKEGDEDEDENDEVATKTRYMLTTNNDHKNAESPLDASGGGEPVR